MYMYVITRVAKQRRKMAGNLRAIYIGVPKKKHVLKFKFELYLLKRSGVP